MNKGLCAIYILTLISLLLYANKHGKPKEGKYNFWIALVGNIITLTLTWWALGWKFI